MSDVNVRSPFRYLSLYIYIRNIAQFGSAPSWGDGGHRFKSCYSEKKNKR